MFCKKCGKSIDDNARFCPECGTPQFGHERAEGNFFKQKKRLGSGIIISAVFLMLAMAARSIHLAIISSFVMAYCAWKLNKFRNM